MAKETKPRKIWKKILIAVIAIIAIVVVAAAALLIWLSATEYKPAASEPAEVRGAASGTVEPGDSLSIMTWNIGYGALGDNADFFMDGGEQVLTADADRVASNMAFITEEVASQDADITILQEVDRDSKRSCYVNEYEEMAASLDGTESSFALNYKTELVPIGWPLYGKIDGGLATFSKLSASSVTRESLPLSYSWPMRLVQLKRCQLVTRIPVEGTDAELVIVNEHPDAYTDEEHHAAQIAAIRDFLEAEAAKGNYVIAGGDWNHAFSSIDGSAYPLLPDTEWVPGYLDAGDFSDGWQFAMDNATPTCRLLNRPLAGEDPDTFQYYLIDGFIVSGNIQVDSIQTQDCGFAASDHNPVVMRFTLL